MDAPEEGEGHIERHDGDEEEVARGDDSGEGGRECECGHSGKGQRNGEADEGEGDEEDAAEFGCVEKRGGGTTLVDRRVMESNGADNKVQAPER